MRNKAVILAIALAVVLLLPTGVSGDDGPAQSDVDLAREAGQDYISNVASTTRVEWKGASLANDQPFHDLEGNLIAYMFTITRNDEPMGSMVVGSSPYQYAVLEAGTWTPLLPSDPGEIGTIIETQLGLRVEEGAIGEPIEYVYLGYPWSYAVYQIEGELIGVNLRSCQAVPLSDLRSSLTPPEEYERLVEAMKAGQVQLPLLSGGNSLSVPLHGMADGDLDKETVNNDNCGPTSGSMIVGYWQEHGYSNFWGEAYWDRNHDGYPSYDNPSLHEGLYDTMKCNQPLRGVEPWDAGSGFVNFAAQEYFDYAFDHEHYSCLLPPWQTSYSKIMSQIDAGQPLMILFYAGPYILHWVAAYGYDYDDDSATVYVNNPQGETGRWDDINWIAHHAFADLVMLEPAYIAGPTGEVNCDILPYTTVEAFKDGVSKGSTVSDGSGNYTLLMRELGDYEVVASKTGFRDETRPISITGGGVYTFDLLAETGLIPNAPSMSYVLGCINNWLYPVPPCGLSYDRVLEVVNAWLYPEGTRVPVSHEEVTVTRGLPRQVKPGKTYSVYITFSAPTDDFNSIAIHDVVPTGWNVSVDKTWCKPDARFENIPEAGTAEYIWFGPYDEGQFFRVKYQFQVPEDAEEGTYTFPGGQIKYFIAGAGYTVDITGDTQVTVR